MNWSYYNQLVAENLETFLEYFQIEYSKSGNAYNFVCPFHEDADSENGFGIYNNKTFLVCYCRTNCEKNIKKDATTFIKRLLSRTNDTSYSETVRFISGLLDKNLPEEAVESINPEKASFISAFEEKMEEQAITNLTREDIRSRLLIPAQYMLNRGFSSQVLNEYDVGLCVTKGKRFYNRIVIPCYDESGNKYVGCTTRSPYEKCTQCKYYHPTNKKCPITKWDKFSASKWLHADLKTQTILFNTWKAKDEIRKTRKAIITEGPLDSIRLASMGIKNSLAIFGNCLKDGQAQILDSLGVMDLIVLLDNDSAGQQGAKEIKEKYGRFYRLYFPNLKDIKDVGEIQTDKETEDIKALLAQIGQV